LAVVDRTVGCQRPDSDDRNHSSQAECRRSVGSNRAYGWVRSISVPSNPGRILEIRC